MWIIFKVFCIEFATTLSLFYVSFFWPWGMWDLSFQIRDWICTPCMGRWSLHHWTTREVPSLLSLWEHNHTIYLHTVLLYTAPFILHWQNCVLLTQTAWAAKPKILTIWLLMEKVCWPLFLTVLPRGLSGKENTSQCISHRRQGFDPWVGTFPGGGNSNSLQYFCLGNAGQRNLAGYSPCGHTSQTWLSDWACMNILDCSACPFWNNTLAYLHWRFYQTVCNKILNFSESQSKLV